MVIVKTVLRILLLWKYRKRNITTVDFLINYDNLSLNLKNYIQYYHYIIKYDGSN